MNGHCLLAVGYVPDAGVFVSFVADDGEHRGRLSQLWAVQFEGVAPVRRVQAFRGQRNFAGAWWLAYRPVRMSGSSRAWSDHLMG